MREEGSAKALTRPLMLDWQLFVMPQHGSASGYTIRSAGLSPAYFTKATTHCLIQDKCYDEDLGSNFMD